MNRDWIKLEGIHPTVLLDPSVQVYGPIDLLKVGKGSRIDANVVITVGPEGVEIGRWCHVGAGAMIFGGGGRVTLGDCCSLSPGAKLFTASDAFGDDDLIGPCCDEDLRAVRGGNVVLADCSAVGANGIVFGPATLGFAAVVGANSFVKPGPLPYPCFIPPGMVMIGANKHLSMVRRDVETIEAKLDEMRRRHAED